MQTAGKGQRLLSTNPLAFSAPGLEGEGVCLDMATSAVAAGKIEVRTHLCLHPHYNYYCKLAHLSPPPPPQLLLSQIAAVKGEAIPPGWAVDGEGRDTTDPRFDTSPHCFETFHCLWVILSL